MIIFFLFRGLLIGLLFGIPAGAVGAFGLTLVSDFLLERQNLIHLAGGCLILLMGVSLLLKKGKNKPDIADTSGFFRMFLSSFAVGITNPAAILTFLLAFSWFGIDGELGWLEGTSLVTGVFIGTYIWWGTLTIGTEKLKKRAKQVDPMRLNKIFGILLFVLGAGILIRLLTI